MVLEVIYAPGWESAILWTVIAGFVICYFLAFGMGANDCANSYGTVVGAGVLKLWHAYVLATVFETAGALLLGYKVTNTIRNGIVDVSMYDVFARYDDVSQMWNSSDAPCITTNTTLDYIADGNCTVYSSPALYYGELGALTGTAVWLISASLFKMPVSATQSVVGALVGFSLVFHGVDGINWYNDPFESSLLAIVLSWIASPLMAGFFSVSLYLVIKFTVFNRVDQVRSAIRMLPFWFWFTLTVNLITVFYNGSKFLHFDAITFWQAVLISGGIGVAVAVIVWFWGGELIEKHALALNERDHEVHNMPVDEVKNAAHVKYELKTVSSTLRFDYEEHLDVDIPKIHVHVPHEIEAPPEVEHTSISGKFIAAVMRPVHEDPVAVYVFNILQIISACVLAFSHGSNDTANAVGPLVAITLSYMDGSADVDEENNPYMELVILYGTLSMLTGLYVLGHKVIATIGKDLTAINAPSGFAMSLGTAFTVLFASKVGIPVSTTHCMVGAVVFVGLVSHPHPGHKEKQAVDWKLFGGIAFAWLVTTPVTGCISALVTYLLSHFILGAP